MLLEMVPDSHHHLLEDETRAFAYLATIMDGGTPQISKIWFNTNDEYILINSTKGRVKDKNMRARPDVALAIEDPESKYRYMQLRGRVVEITEEGALDHIHILAGKYTGTPKFNGMQADMVRVIYKIEPQSISAMG